jgi:hypothetical protein
VGTCSHAGCSLLSGKTGTNRESAAEALGDGHDVRRDAGPFMGKEPAGAAHAALHFIKQQKDAVLITELADRPQLFRRQRPDAAFALHRLDQDAGSGFVDGCFQCLMVAESNLLETRHARLKSLKIFLVTGCGKRCKGAAMEGAFKGDDGVALGTAVGGVILPGHLDGAFKCLGARVAEEHGVGKSQFDQPLRQPFLARHLIDV